MNATFRFTLLVGCVQIINERHGGGDGSKTGGPLLDRLVPRTEDVPIYSVVELNDKVIWLLVV